MSRKAAKTPAAGRGVQDISLARRAQLDAGAPASNLTECLAVDFAALMAVAVPQAGADAPPLCARRRRRAFPGAWRWPAP
ncbi:hypothetical protein WJ970_21380 [Achromobacter xylosoxidans]